jgi:hypothetical protein
MVLTGFGAVFTTALTTLQDFLIAPGNLTVFGVMAGTYAIYRIVRKIWGSATKPRV